MFLSTSLKNPFLNIDTSINVVNVLNYIFKPTHLILCYS